MHIAQVLSSSSTLTARQREVFEFIRTYRGKNGFSPSTQEIARKLKIASPTAVLGHLTALEKKGFIQRSARISRSIIPLCVQEKKDFPATIAANVQGGKFVSCSSEDASRYLESVRTTFQDNFLFLRILDDQFVRYSIFRGDYLLVRRTRTAFQHEIAILRDVDDELLIGKCVRDPRTNQTYIKTADIFERRWIPNRSLCGILVSVVRDFSTYFS